MKIYDISQEVFKCNVFPGDLSPTYERTLEIKNKDLCNLTVFQMCAHNGTHVDAPYHFIEDGKTVDQIELSHFVGEATVVEAEGILLKEDVKKIMMFAHKRILLKGKVEVSLEAAKEFNQHQILLLGNESQTIGPFQTPEFVHLELLEKEVVLLEGVRLQDVPVGHYFLNAAPINLGGADGAPCRAILVDMKLDNKE